MMEVSLQSELLSDLLLCTKEYEKVASMLSGRIRLLCSDEELAHDVDLLSSVFLRKQLDSRRMKAPVDEVVYRYMQWHILSLYNKRLKYSLEIKNSLIGWYSMNGSNYPIEEMEDAIIKDLDFTQYYTNGDKDVTVFVHVANAAQLCAGKDDELCINLLEYALREEFGRRRKDLPSTLGRIMDLLRNPDMARLRSIVSRMKELPEVDQAVVSGLEDRLNSSGIL